MSRYFAWMSGISTGVAIMLLMSGSFESWVFVANVTNAVGCGVHSLMLTKSAKKA